MKNLFYFLFLFCFSCNFINIQPKKQPEAGFPIASVQEAKLYIEDIQNLLPKKISVQDSLVLVKSLINSWATKQLLLQKAIKNITENNSKSINELVKNYRESLFINDYKERLIKQQLDTIVLEEKISEYYKIHKENFKLNEELLAVKYIHFGNNFLDKNEVIKKFTSKNASDKKSLEEKTINFKSFELRDSIWVPVEVLQQKIPPLQAISKENLLKKTKFYQKQDSLGVYLVAVEQVLKRNDIAPKSYISYQIKQLILHQRKLELIREIEKTLLNDAIKNKQFKEY